MFLVGEFYTKTFLFHHCLKLQNFKVILRLTKESPYRIKQVGGLVMIKNNKRHVRECKCLLISVRQYKFHLK